MTLQHPARGRAIDARPVATFAVALAMALGFAVALPTAVVAQMNAMVKEQLDRIPNGEAGVAQILDPMTQRLALRPEQVDAVRPIIVELVSNMQSAKTKLEIGETTIMKFMVELNAQGDAAATRVEQYLDEDQVTKYAAMRREQKLRMMEERRRAMREMVKERQAAASSGAEAGEAP